MSAAYDTTITSLAAACGCANDALTVAATLDARALTALRAGVATSIVMLMQYVAKEIRRREGHDGRAASFGTAALTDAAGHLGP